MCKGKNVRRNTRYIPADYTTMTISEMFEEFMLVKKGEGLAKRTISEHYLHFGYFMNYIGRELSASEMTTELCVGWITYMLEEMEYALLR
ncbi:hypothetical protein [Peribacillus sp. SCS-155]|uniref:hypothetical protein n=1 Tax=Peribacillus sedimenti TaxID=3115297 RepID=UPI0039058837